jgi:hypothetical protein
MELTSLLLGFIMSFIPLIFCRIFSTLILCIFSFFVSANQPPLWQYVDGSITQMVEKFKLTASDGVVKDGFGKSFAFDNGVIVVAAPSNAEDNSSGSVYVFTADDQGVYSQSQKLTATDAEANHIFGRSVAITNGVIVVSAFTYEIEVHDSDGYIYTSYPTTSTSVYVFTTDVQGVYSQSQKITSNNGNFGESIVLDKDIMIVKNDDESVDIFTTDDQGIYSQKQQLTASDAAENDSFGTSIAFDNGVIIVGAIGVDGDNGANSGSVYVFKADEQGFYSQSQKLIASDGAEKDYFGRSIVIDNGTIVVGVSHDDDNGFYSGSAYIFTANDQGIYSQSQKLIPKDNASHDYFGNSVAIENGVIVVGAKHDDDKGGSSGSVYVFTADTQGIYSQSHKLAASDGEVSDIFGTSVALDNGVIFVTAPYNYGRYPEYPTKLRGLYVFENIEHYSVNSATLTVTENLEVDNALLLAKDADGDDLTYTLSGHDSALFNVSNTGMLTFISLPDFEAPYVSDVNNLYKVTLTVSDGSLSSALALTINVIDSPDTDLNGVEDSLDSDDDNDGVPDVIEIVQGTNSLSSLLFLDTDGDGIPDYFEDGTYGNNINVADAIDSNNNGISDYNEAFTGINQPPVWQYADDNISQVIDKFKLTINDNKVYDRFEDTFVVGNSTDDNGLCCS